MTDRGTISRLAYTAALTSDLARPRCITVSEVCDGFRPRSTPKNPFKRGKGRGGTRQFDRLQGQFNRLQRQFSPLQRQFASLQTIFSLTATICSLTATISTDFTSILYSGGGPVNHLSDHERSRPAGQGIAPLVAAAELVELLQMVDQAGDTRTLSGVPLPLETAWCEQDLGPTYARFGDTRWAAAWRMLLAHARTGWNWVADLQALELTVTGTPPPTRTQQRAVVLLLDSGLLQRHYLYLSRATKRPDHRQAGFVWLTPAGVEMLHACGVEPAQVLQSEWIQMAAAHDPFDTQRNHTAHCVLAARLARAHGYRALLMPAGPGPVRFDLRLTDAAGESWYVECEARRLSRVATRLRKWQALEREQEIAPVVALNPSARRALFEEIILPGIPVRATDLFSLLQGRPEFWIEDDLHPAGGHPHSTGD